MNKVVGLLNYYICMWQWGINKVKFASWLRWASTEERPMYSSSSFATLPYREIITMLRPFAPPTTPSEKDPVTNVQRLARSWDQSGEHGKFSPTGIRSLDCPSRSELLYRLNHPERQEKGFQMNYMPAAFIKLATEVAGRQRASRNVSNQLWNKTM